MYTTSRGVKIDTQTNPYAKLKLVQEFFRIDSDWDQLSPIELENKIRQNVAEFYKQPDEVKAFIVDEVLSEARLETLDKLVKKIIDTEPLILRVKKMNNNWDKQSLDDLIILRKELNSAPIYLEKHAEEILGEGRFDNVHRAYENYLDNQRMMKNPLVLAIIRMQSNWEQLSRDEIKTYIKANLEDILTMPIDARQYVKSILTDEQFMLLDELIAEAEQEKSDAKEAADIAKSSTNMANDLNSSSRGATDKPYDEFQVDKSITEHPLVVKIKELNDNWSNLSRDDIKQMAMANLKELEDAPDEVANYILSIMPEQRITVLQQLAEEVMKEVQAVQQAKPATGESTEPKTENKPKPPPGAPEPPPPLNLGADGKLIMPPKTENKPKPPPGAPEPPPLNADGSIPKIEKPKTEKPKTEVPGPPADIKIVLDSGETVGIKDGLMFDAKGPLPEESMANVGIQRPFMARRKRIRNAIAEYKKKHGLTTKDVTGTPGGGDGFEKKPKTQPVRGNKGPVVVKTLPDAETMIDGVKVGIKNGKYFYGDQILPDETGNPAADAASHFKKMKINAALKKAKK